jgi:hypothetical protein
MSAILFGISPAGADEPASWRDYGDAVGADPRRIRYAPEPTRHPLPVEVQHGNVIVRAEDGMYDEADRLAWQAEETLHAIAPDLAGLDIPAFVEIRYVRDADDMQAAAPAGAQVPTWAAGVAFPSRGIIIIARWRGGHELDPEGTLDHELAHLALGAALGDHAPRWLHEGFAYLHSTDWSWEREQTLAGMAWFGSVIPLDQLEVGFPAEELPASRAYAESYDFVSFLARRGRFPDATDDGDRYPFRRFLAEVAAHGDLDLAATRAYGRPLQPLFDEWRSQLKQRYMFAPIGFLLFSIWMIAGVLLVLAWRRRRRQNRVRLAEWEAIERAAREREAREAGEDRAPETLVVPIWAGPAWAPPGAPVSEPADADDVEAVLEEDEDAPRPPPPPRQRPMT